MSSQQVANIENVEAWTAGVEVDAETLQRLSNISAPPILAGHTAATPGANGDESNGIRVMLRPEHRELSDRDLGRRCAGARAFSMRVEAPHWARDHAVHNCTLTMHRALSVLHEKRGHAVAKFENAVRAVIPHENTHTESKAKSAGIEDRKHAGVIDGVSAAHEDIDAAASANDTISQLPEAVLTLVQAMRIENSCRSDARAPTTIGCIQCAFIKRGYEPCRITQTRETTLARAFISKVQTNSVHQ